MRRMLSNMKIRNKYLVVTMLITCMGMSVMGFFFYRHTSEIIAKNAFFQISQTISQTTTYVNDKLLFLVNLFSALEMDKDFVRISAAAQAENPVEDFVRMASIFEKTRMQSGSLIEDILFFRTDGRIFYEYTSMINEAYDYRSAPWYEKVSEADFNVVWSPTGVTEPIRARSPGFSFGLFKYVTNSYFAPKGVLAFNLKGSFLAQTLENMDLGEGSAIFIVNEKLETISGGNSAGDVPPDAGLAAQVYAREEAFGYFYYGTGAASRMVVYDTLTLNGWKVIASIPTTIYREELAGALRTTVLIVIVSVLVAAVLSSVFVSMLTKPVRKLVELMYEVKKGNLRVHFPTGNNDEIGVMGQTFNEMIQSMESLMNTVREEREMSLHTRLRMLQEHINSHFLYNTLDSIYWTSKTGRGEDAANMTANLASFFRLALNDGAEMTTVEKEAQHIASYIAIEKIRYGDRFHYTIDVEEAARPLIVPKLILQPLVENSIVHGVYEMDEPGFIQVEIRWIETELVLSVRDNGAGMDVEKIWENINDYVKNIQNYKGAGYALYNVYNRLKLLYGDRARLVMESGENRGALIALYLPIEREKGEKDS